MLDFNLMELGKMRHQEMLQEAERERRWRRIQRNATEHASWWSRMLARAGNALIGSGTWLKKHASLSARAS